MELCWSINPDRRPGFAQAVQQVASIRGALAVSPDGLIKLGSDNELIHPAPAMPDDGYLGIGHHAGGRVTAETAFSTSVRLRSAQGYELDGHNAESSDDYTAFAPAPMFSAVARHATVNESTRENENGGGTRV